MCPHAAMLSMLRALLQWGPRTPAISLCAVSWTSMLQHGGYHCICQGLMQGTLKDEDRVVAQWQWALMQGQSTSRNQKWWCRNQAAVSAAPAAKTA